MTADRRGDDATGSGSPENGSPTGGIRSSRVERWLAHIRVLAGDIGFRLPTSEGEAKAADYCRTTFAEIGLRPETDEFQSIGSVFRPHLAASLIFLAAFAVYPLALPATGWAALVLSLFALVSEIMEITLRPHLIHKLLPKRPSRNVFAVVEPAASGGRPAGDAADAAGRAEADSAPRIRDLVLIGHMDTQRTPIIFSTAGWMAAYRLFSTVAFVAFVGQVVLYAGGILAGWAWAWAASGLPALMAVLLAALTLQADSTPSTHGANDNATAAGLVLTLAEDFRAEPLRRTRVWFLCSGCEESLHEGAKTFFARHKEAMNQPLAVAFEMLGCAGPAWLLDEGFVLPLRSHPDLRAAAGRVAAAHPGLRAQPARIRGGVTEMSDAILAGVPAITVAGVTPEGTAPHWHRPSDTVDKMDSSPGGALERNYRFARALLEEIDRGER